MDRQLVALLNNLF